MRKMLVLDVGGVLATNLTPSLWQQLAALGSCDEQQLYANYKQEISEQLWCGHITEQQWWEWLTTRGVDVAAEQRASIISQHLIPLPALELLPTWSKLCDIYIMSNHRTEWLTPLLSSSRSFLRNIYISDTTGLSKPNLCWFEQINEQINGQMSKVLPTSIHFVDDSEKNIRAAKHVGWLTTLADANGDWIVSVNKWLHSQ